MAEIRHLENRDDVIFFCRGWSDFDKISQTGAEQHVAWGDMVKIETRCRIPIRRTFGRIPWHVIPEPPATLQGAATWRIQHHEPRAMCHIAGCCHRANSTACHPRATYNIAGCCHLVNSLSWFLSHIPCSHLEKLMSWSCHIAGCKNSIRHIENRFSPYFIYLVFVARCHAYAVMRCLYACLSVCLCVCVSVRHVRESCQNESSKFFHHRVATPF